MARCARRSPFRAWDTRRLGTPMMRFVLLSLVCAVVCAVVDVSVRWRLLRELVAQSCQTGQPGIDLVVGMLVPRLVVPIGTTDETEATTVGAA